MRPLARLLTAVLLAALVVSSAPAADKDEDKAKEVAVAFLKAVKAKDADAALKLTDVPFLLDARGKGNVVEKAADLKAQLTELITNIKDTDRITTDVLEVLPTEKFRAKFTKEGNKEHMDTMEKVMGKTGFAVVLGRDGKPAGGLLVAIKDGKAKVVGIPR
jgi:hypothetical protein